MHSSQGPHQALNSVAGRQNRVLQVQKGDECTVRPCIKFFKSRPKGRPPHLTRVSGRFFPGDITQKVTRSLQVRSAISCNFISAKIPGILLERNDVMKTYLLSSALGHFLHRTNEDKTLVNPVYTIINVLSAKAGG
jgi:hypothetical protein